MDPAPALFSYSRARSNSTASQSSALEGRRGAECGQQPLPAGEETKPESLRSLVYDALEAGDEEAVRRHVASGVDVNGEDEHGRSLIAYLILGATSFKDTDLADDGVARALAASAPLRLRVLRAMRTRGAFSLYTLNAPQPAALGGLTPLGMAAYLARLEFVQALLEGPGGSSEGGDGAVLVDGVDVHRATPLMYAARDGHLDIVQYLLDNGARPDAADCHHRSVLFYAATHPACLWACERTLRLRRARRLLSPRARRTLKLNLPHDANAYAARTTAYAPPPPFAAPGSRHLSADHPDAQASLRPLVTAIRRGDVAAVHTLLFPPAAPADADAPPPVPPKDRPLASKYSCSSLSSQFALGAGVSGVVRPRPRSSSLPFPRVYSSAAASASALPTIAQEPPAPPAPAPATLVNMRDAGGWAPIHHALAAPRPSARILDALYLAGADLALYTGDNQDAPLHCLARADPSAPAYYASPASTRAASAPVPRHGGFSAFQLYAFVTHAVRDLGAPLGARDLDGNTALHIAAAEGHSLDVLMALLDCDADGAVRRARNAQGYTARDLARTAEFRLAFDAEEGAMRPESAASVRTVRPSASCSSFVSAASGSTLGSGSGSDDSEEEEEEELERIGTEQFPPCRPHAEEELRAELASGEDAERVVGALTRLAGELTQAEREADEREFDLESRPLPPARGRGRRGEGDVEGGEREREHGLDLDEMEGRLHATWRGASAVLERLRRLVDLAAEDLARTGAVKAGVAGLVERLERRRLRKAGRRRGQGRWEGSGTGDGVYRDGEEGDGYGKDARSPRAATPTLTHSAGSSSAGSFASFASFSQLASAADGLPVSGIRELRLADVVVVDGDERAGADDAAAADGLLPALDLDAHPKKSQSQSQSRRWRGYGEREQGRGVRSRSGSGSGSRASAAAAMSAADGVELVSVPPIVALEATAPTSPISLSFDSPAPRRESAGGAGAGIGGVGGDAAGTEWLGPYVRQTNSLTFQQHLENLMEIERTLFGGEAADFADAGQQEEGAGLQCGALELGVGGGGGGGGHDALSLYVPSPDDVGMGAEGRLDVDLDMDMDWRDCVEHFIEDVAQEGEGVLAPAPEDDLRRNAVYVEAEEEGDFLDMFAVNELRTRTPSPSPLPSPPRSATPAGPLTPLDLLARAKGEVSQLEETISESEQRIERAQRYLAQAEHLTSRVFQAKEHALQAARLAHALRELCGDGGRQQQRQHHRDGAPWDSERCSTPELCGATRAPASSPTATRSTAALDHFVFATAAAATASAASPSRSRSAAASAQVSRQPSMQSLLAVPMPMPMSMRAPLPLPLSAAAPAPLSSVARAAEEDDMRQLRRLLVRKIPARLERALDAVDTAGVWAGVLQAVLCRLQAGHCTSGAGS